MVNAIVAMEDQNYWEHEWLDPWGIFRAALKGKWWASTLPQQLMTNVFKLKAWLTSADKSWLQYKLDKVAYKLRQIVLAKRLNSTLQKQVKAENPNLSNDEAKKEMKKKVLELYLNYIEFGNNSFWVEAAAKAFFGVSAKDLTIAQSAVLASLPKWPWQYSPLTESGRKQLMW
jgi:penicillin-binding protein 1A